MGRRRVDSREIFDSYQKGVSITLIAARYDVTVTWIHVLARREAVRRDVKLRGRLGWRTTDLEKYIIENRNVFSDKTVSIRELGKKIKTNVSRLGRILKKLGVRL